MNWIGSALVENITTNLCTEKMGIMNPFLQIDLIQSFTISLHDLVPKRTTFSLFCEESEGEINVPRKHGI